MQYVTAVFNGIYNLFGQKEETYEIQIRHGGNQQIDEFYMEDGGVVDYSKKQFITLHVGKSKTILDVKKELINNIKYLQNTRGIHLRLVPFGDSLHNDRLLSKLPFYGNITKEEFLKLFISIPGW